MITRPCRFHSLRSSCACASWFAVSQLLGMSLSSAFDARHSTFRASLSSTPVLTLICEKIITVKPKSIPLLSASDDNSRNAGTQLLPLRNSLIIV
ncbi:hypothetical protein ARMSODRAFT_188732 [Armillaria solidipes]|uniref:Uncharacterized protein n=1 Tax=Armillaria solidipes TaxID=1076256 RepID=A0A2H3C094_9AGAR|nr:hypothetical protein ARMSODRAFT_188732 [Armillaria solidipes]